ncbi:MAG: SpoIIIAC/SpoIIIAD family protein [Blautia sp.]
MTKVAVLGLTGVLLGLLMKEAESCVFCFCQPDGLHPDFFCAVNRLGFLADRMQEIRQAVPVDEACLKILMKMLGVTYLADFTANLCRDAGYSAIAGQVEFFGKLSLLTLSLPVLAALMETVSQMLLQGAHEVGPDAGVLPVLLLFARKKQLLQGKRRKQGCFQKWRRNFFQNSNWTSSTKR